MADVYEMLAKEIADCIVGVDLYTATNIVEHLHNAGFIDYDTLKEIYLHDEGDDE
jgi:Mn-dependent DtxR family transcriptional regulator